MWNLRFFSSTKQTTRSNSRNLLQFNTTLTTPHCTLTFTLRRVQISVQTSSTPPNTNTNTKSVCHATQAHTRISSHLISHNKVQPSLFLSLPSNSNSMGSASASACAQQDQEETNSYFDRIPDDILHLILNKVLDAKTLLRCLSLSKRFASLVPRTDAVSLPLFFPPRPRHYHPTIRLRGSPVNILKSLVNYLIAKPLVYLLCRNRRRDPLSDSPPLLLRTFHHITHLHFELHSYGGSVDADFLKWKATYCSELKSCVVLCATSFHRGAELTAEEEGGEEEPEDETTPSSSEPALPNEEFKSRIMWTISCLIAASARHFLLKQMLAQFPTLRTIVITDANKQGRFSMEEAGIRDLRDSLKRGGAVMLSPDVRVVPDVRMRMSYVRELELPALGCVMKGATLLVISPADNETVPAEEKGIDGGFDGDESEKAVFCEAEREIAKKKKKSNYVMEMTSF